MFFLFFSNHIVFSLQTQLSLIRVVVGGHLKWTPQRPCLGNEIASDMAFCHVSPQCILMICGAGCSVALQDSRSDTSLIRIAAHSLPLVGSVSFLLVFLFVPLLFYSEETAMSETEKAFSGKWLLFSALTVKDRDAVPLRNRLSVSTVHTRDRHDLLLIFHHITTEHASN